MPFSDYALNLMANEVANRTLSVRIHTGDPGANGTANRIGSHEIAVAADGWTNAATGNVENVAAVAFGVLHTGNANTVRWYSLWDGSNFVARGELAADAPVPANQAFTINAGTIDLTIRST